MRGGVAAVRGTTPRLTVDGLLWQRGDYGKVYPEVAGLQRVGRDR
jgi:hypothetical protein